MAHGWLYLLRSESTSGVYLMLAKNGVWIRLDIPRWSWNIATNSKSRIKRQTPSQDMRLFTPPWGLIFSKVSMVSLYRCYRCYWRGFYRCQDTSPSSSSRDPCHHVSSMSGICSGLHTPAAWQYDRSTCRWTAPKSWQSLQSSKLGKWCGMGWSSSEF